MNIFFYRTNWAFLLYMLYDTNWEQTLYCFVSEKEVPLYFKQNGIKYYVFRQNEFHDSLIHRIYGRCIDELNYWKFIKNIRAIRYKHCYGDDDSVLSKPFIDNDFCVVEDGLANYTPWNIEYLQSIGLIGHGCKYKTMGFDPIIKKVLLSGAFQLPDEMIKKAILIDVRKKWQEKSSDEQKKIMSVFQTNEEELASYNSDYVLLTQNFDAYNLHSEESEFTRYAKILKNYPYGRVLIKPHPASSFDYSKNFPNYCIVRKGLPFELLELYNNYKVLISINSTAAFTVPGDKRIDLYDMDGKLQKTFKTWPGHRIDARKISSLVPRVQKKTITIKQVLQNQYYLLLRKLIWHIQ